ncbi:MAG TPA: NADPH-dependent FMN reductase [Ruminococcaceae bacterium]|nr:NADPH-dependent FMN reductase [Oscillospiraceae bacterium]
MKVLVVETSLRKNSNSDRLAEAFARGAAETGAEVETVSLKDKKIGFCIGCLSCQNTGKCVLKDDMAELNRKLHDCDAVAFSTPIYYYEMSGQMKTFLDRANPLYGTDYRFQKVYLLATATDDAETTPDRALTGLDGWVECFERATLAGSVFVGGVTDPGEIDGNDGLSEAYALGKSVKE